MFGGPQWFWGFWWICPIFMIIMIIVFIFVMRRFSCMSGWRSPDGGAGQTSAGTAEDILKRRYALGEISKKEYEEMKRDIS
jgi:putative membrane protein